MPPRPQRPRPPPKTKQPSPKDFHPKVHPQNLSLGLLGMTTFLLDELEAAPDVSALRSRRLSPQVAPHPFSCSKTSYLVPNWPVNQQPFMPRDSDQSSQVLSFIWNRVLPKPRR